MRALVSTSYLGIKQLMEDLKATSSGERKIWCNSENMLAQKNLKQREPSAIGAPDRRLEAVSEVVKDLGQQVKHLVTSTSVKAMRLVEVERFKDEFPQVYQVREMVKVQSLLFGRRSLRIRKRIVDLIGSSASPDESCLNNLVYVLRGEDLVEPPSWSRSCSAQRLKWLHVIETQQQAEFSS
jgi:hypothetical protein